MVVGTATRFTPNPAVQFREVDGKGILLNTSTGDCFELNRVCSVVWQSTAEGKSPQEVADSLSAAYGLAREIVEADVLETLTELVRHGLLVAPSQ